MVNSRDELVQRLQLNDEVAYHELIDAYGDKIIRLAYMVVGDRQVAEDVVQESFIALYQKVGQFRGASSLETWLTRIALNKAKNKVRPSFLQRITYMWELNFVDKRPSPQDSYESKERQELIKEVMLSLPLKYRDVLYLYYYEEMKIREIAEVLDITISGVKSRLQRGREQAKKLLGERGLE
ncbi:RNA polymerase sigma-70 factor (ECF subfamily) [Desulfitispora alkaliphila]|uniref:RNA polymerase sigma factor n=1 Tax=Desulfitispora alkaliphila TaxID=622674 RepID=UPI003D210D26